MGFLIGSFWGGGRKVTPTPCLKLVRIMLETSNLARKYTQLCSLENIPFSTKALLIAGVSIFFANNQHFLAKIVPLLEAIMWELC